MMDKEELRAEIEEIAKEIGIMPSGLDIKWDSGRRVQVSYMVYHADNKPKRFIVTMPYIRKSVIEAVRASMQKALHAVLTTKEEFYKYDSKRR